MFQLSEMHLGQFLLKNFIEVLYQIQVLRISAKFGAVTKIVKTRHVNFGIFPCVKTTSLRPDAKMEEHVSFFKHVKADAKPSQKAKKGGAKRSVALLKESIFSTRKGNWDQNTPSNSPMAHGTKLKFGKERVHREELSKSVNLMNVVLARKNSGKDNMKRPCNKRDPPAEYRGIWRNICTSSRMRTMQRLILVLKQR